MKKCSFCAEEIQDEAIKCKHCGSMLDEKCNITVSGVYSLQKKESANIAELSGEPEEDVSRLLRTSNQITFFGLDKNKGRALLEYFRSKGLECAVLKDKETLQTVRPSTASDYRQVKKGIKQVEWDQFTYNIRIFFSILLGVGVGVLVGLKFGKGFGWFAGFVVFAIVGVASLNSYYEFDKKK